MPDHLNSCQRPVINKYVPLVKTEVKWDRLLFRATLSAADIFAFPFVVNDSRLRLEVRDSSALLR